MNSRCINSSRPLRTTASSSFRVAKRFETAFPALITAFLITFSGQAKSEFQWGAGFGMQYAGVFGVQGAYKIHKTKLKGALGLTGAGAGIEQHLTERVSIGYQAFRVWYAKGWGFYGNYYIPTTGSKSWVIGLDILRSYRTEISARPRDKKNKLLVSIGYNF